jgi:MerR family transcriptional regulator, light-induced transcriptional regulator
MNKPQAMHRIGTIARLADIPAPTLRVWESRYQAFTPDKTSGRHRLYSDEDLLRATLLKQLCQDGHAISTIANLDAQALSQLRHKHHGTGTLKAQQQLQAHTVNMAVVGLGLAGRIESKKFTLSFANNHIKVTHLYADLAAARHAVMTSSPHILLVKTSTLHDIVMTDIQQILARHGIAQAIVIYNYGSESVAQAMRQAGMIVRREPISDHELADLIGSVLLADPTQSMGEAPASALIPPRKYSEDTLARVAGIATSVLCECPRHVAEIISQLASFEQYSQECLNKSSEDAHLHAHLASVSGSARALFERALEMVALHEGIDLAAPPNQA